MARFLSMIFLIPFAIGFTVTLGYHGPETICNKVGAGAMFIAGLIGIGIFLLTENDAPPRS